MKAYYNITVGDFVPTEDGGLLVKNVPIMACGEWTAMQGIYTRFSPDVLMKCASNWMSYGIWTRHPGGSPRDATEKIGVVRDPHYDPSIAGGAVVGDLYLHQRSSESKSAGQLVQTPEAEGGISSVSAETELEMDNNGTVTNIVFTGLALVDEGACTTCRIKAYAKQEERQPASNAGGENMEEVEKKDPSALKGEADTKTEEVNNEGHEEEMKEGIEPKLIMILAEALDQVVPGTKDLIEETMKSSVDEIATATNMGRIQQALLACGGKKTYSVPETMKTEFEKFKQEHAMLKAQFEQFGKQTANNGLPVPKREEKDNTSEVELGCSIGNLSRASMRGVY